MRRDSVIPAVDDSLQSRDAAPLIDRSFIDAWPKLDDSVQEVKRQSGIAIREAGNEGRRIIRRRRRKRPWRIAKTIANRRGRHALNERTVVVRSFREELLVALELPGETADDVRFLDFRNRFAYSCEIEPTDPKQW